MRDNFLDDRRVHHCIICKKYMMPPLVLFAHPNLSILFYLWLSIGESYLISDVLLCSLHSWDVGIVVVKLDFETKVRKGVRAYFSSMLEALLIYDQSEYMRY